MLGVCWRRGDVTVMTTVETGVTRPDATLANQATSAGQSRLLTCPDGWLPGNVVLIAATVARSRKRFTASGTKKTDNPKFFPAHLYSRLANIVVDCNGAEIFTSSPAVPILVHIVHFRDINRKMLPRYSGHAPRTRYWEHRHIPLFWILHFFFPPCRMLPEYSFI